jgi:hypothetical protein
MDLLSKQSHTLSPSPFGRPPREPGESPVNPAAVAPRRAGTSHFAGCRCARQDRPSSNGSFRPPNSTNDAPPCPLDRDLDIISWCMARVTGSELNGPHRRLHCSPGWFRSRESAGQDGCSSDSCHARRRWHIQVPLTDRPFGGAGEFTFSSCEDDRGQWLRDRRRIVVKSQPPQFPVPGTAY